MTKTTSNRKDKFVYKKGELKVVKDSLKEGILPFTKFLSKKEVVFDENTMRWITIYDTNNRRQHVLISKKDGTILAGMGGTRNGESIKNVFKDFDEVKNGGFDKSKALTGEAIHYECSLEFNADLTNEERKHITDYSGNMYKFVNDCLRRYDEIMNNSEEDPLVGYSGMTARELVEYADVISNALKKHKTPKPIVTYRGVNEDYVNMMKKEFKVGNCLIDNGFVSTSSDIDVAKAFCEDGYLMEVHIPKGSRAASIDSLSNFSGVEKEVLIDRNAQLIIKEVDKKNKKIVVEIEHDE